MPSLALTRAGVASVVLNGPRSARLWIGSDVLSGAEVKHLRALGFEVSVFARPVRTQSEVEDVIPTLREHHPSEPVWIESPEERSNPRSSDIGQAFLWREYIVGVEYKHNDFVAVISGSHTGQQGSLVSLLTIEPEPAFVLESESGQDIQVRQSDLKCTDA